MGKAGTLTIDVDAGVAKFIVDMDRAGSKVRDFGGSANEAGNHVTSSMAKSGAAIRLLENPLAANTRALERFLTLLPGASKLVEAAFPIIGAVALVEAFNRAIQQSEEMKRALTELKTAAEATDSAFGQMVSTIDRVNVGAIGRQFGPAAEGLAHARELGAQVRDDQNQILKLQSDLKSTRSSVATESPFKSLASGDAGAQVGSLFGPAGTAVGKAIGAGIASGFTQEVNAKKAKIQEAIDKLQAEIAAKTKESDDALVGAGFKASEQSGSLTAARLKNAEAESQRFADLAKQQSQAKIEADHAAETERIAGLDSELERVVQTGEEEVRYQKAKAADIASYALATRDRLRSDIGARANAQSAGKTTPEKALIGVTAEGDISKANDDYAKTVGEGQLAVQKAVEQGALNVVRANKSEAKSWDELTREAAKAALERRKSLNESIGERSGEALKGNLEQYKVEEATGKGQGEIAAARLKAQYDEQGIHSVREEIAYRMQLAAIEDQAYTAELTALASRIKAAGAIEDQIERAKQLRDLQAEIAALSGRAQASNLGNSGQTGALQNQQNLGFEIGQDIKGAIQQLPQTLGSALSHGIFEHGKGQGIGKDVGQGLKQTGEELTSKFLQASIQQLIVKMGLQTAAQTALATLTGTHVAVMAANIVATGANAAATTGNTITTLGNTIATEWNTIWLAIKSVFGFAGGTDSAPGGLSWVGEKGPELMNVPRGAQIIPNHRTASYLQTAQTQVNFPSTEDYMQTGGSAVNPRDGDSFSGNHTFHIYETSNAKETAAQVARHLTTRLPSLSKYAR